MPTKRKNKNQQGKETGPLWKNKFVFWNLIALIFVKAVFSYSGLQFASILEGVPVFAKEEIVSQTNTLRSFLGLEKFKESAILDQAASQKLQYMISSQYFAHTSPSGISPWHLIEKNNYNYTYAGENLAIGFLTAKDTVNAWANSPSHRQNLLNRNFKEMGVAVAPAKIQDSEGFLVVQLFGTPAPAKVAAAAKPAPSVSPPAYSPTPSVSAQPAQKSTAKETPVSVTVAATTPTINKISRTFNAALILYSLLAFLVSLVFVAFVGIQKGLVIRTAASFTIMLLAVAVPVIQISRTALIL